MAILLQQLREFVDGILQLAALHVLHGESVARKAVGRDWRHHAAQNIQPVIRHACATIPAGWRVLSSIRRLLFPGRSGLIRPGMPLGDPHTGVCTADGRRGAGRRRCERAAIRVTRAVCVPTFPAAMRPTPCASGSCGGEAGMATIRYVIERDHHPFDDGTLELRTSRRTGRRDHCWHGRHGRFSRATSGGTVDGTALAGKPVRESQSEYSELALPNDANTFGFLLGGKVMHLVDLAGAIAAIRHARHARGDGVGGPYELSPSGADRPIGDGYRRR